MSNKKIILLFILIFFSCTKKGKAIGEDNEIIIITSNEDKEFTELALADLLNKHIYTPTEEPIYNVNFIKPENFSNYLTYKNIIVSSIHHPVDSTIDMLNNRFFNQFNQSNIFRIKDLYAEGQIILFLKEYDSNQLNNLIITNLKR